MLDRVESKDKEKVQFSLEPVVIHNIRKRSAELGQTQSKYITDLVEAEIDGKTYSSGYAQGHHDCYHGKGV